MKLVAIAAVSAVLTATVVIGAGRTLAPEAEAVNSEQPGLTRVAFRRG